MKGFVGITDNDWFAFLSEQPGIDEVGRQNWGGTKLTIWYHFTNEIIGDARAEVA